MQRQVLGVSAHKRERERALLPTCRSRGLHGRGESCDSVMRRAGGVVGVYSMVGYIVVVAL